MGDIHDQKILILDFGSQYTQLIARRVRESRVYCEIHPCTLPLEAVRRFGARGIILSGGPSSVYDEGAPLADPGLFELGLPVLGICYGMQLMTHLLGGEVGKGLRREYGLAHLLVDDPRGILAGFHPGEAAPVWMSHGDRIERLPPGFSALAHSDNSPVAAMAHGDKPLFGVQFHPEVVHTPRGTEMIENFLFDVCGLEPSWTMGSFIESSIRVIRERVGGGKVICALSGGVDSSVVALLLHKALGDRLVCIFVDNGVLRKGEAEKVVRTFRDHFHMNLRHVDAADLFLGKLRGVEDPEQKRKIIGNEFIYLFEREAQGLGGAEWLAQGTLYPDVIESVSFKGPSATIKSHHNVGGLPERMNLKLIEPLRELFKDEAREVGRELGLPEEILERHPFPGPGLAIRVLGEVTRERLAILREADAIVREEISAAGLQKVVWQAFCVLLPVKTVGVMGDERTYENVVAVRSVNSLDGMTADWSRLPYEVLGRMSNRIINEVRGVNRVVYDVSSKPPATIEWESALAAPRGTAFVVSAPSGAGKSTLIRGLRDRVPGLGFSVSHTTRPPRAGETDGVQYHFVGRPEFEALAREGAFAEWAEVHGSLYGTSFASLDAELEKGGDVILDIDVQGALQIAERVPGAILVFVLPPSLGELRRRLEGRGTDAPEAVERRVANARGEVAWARGYHYLVVNEDLEQALGELCAIVRAERCRTEKRLELIEELVQG